MAQEWLSVMEREPERRRGFLPELKCFLATSSQLLLSRSLSLGTLPS